MLLAVTLLALTFDRASPPCPDGTVFVPPIPAASPASAVDGPFCIDRTEVTVAAYRACVTSGECPVPETSVHFPGYGPPEPMRTELSRFCNATRDDHEGHPMNCVDRATAARYCAWAGGRLPEEAEWERAARGRPARAYPWGDRPPGGSDAPLCWDRRETAEGTCPVGRFPAGATPEGALDMAGDVWEWTATTTGGEYVVRGGGWTNFLPGLVTTTYRWPLTPGMRLNCLGFRCIRPVSGPRTR